MNFAYPQSRIFLVLAFAAAGLAVLALVRKRRALRRLAHQGIHQPGVLVRPARQILKCVLLLLVAGLLGVALLGPQWGWIEEEIPPRRGRDVVIILDVSRSMLAEDVAPNRLERARADLRDLTDSLERAGGYRIGLIGFAERAAVLCPLTSDYRCFAEELADASLKSLRLRGHAAWGDGTQISTALDRAGQIIDEDNAAYTDVLLVSDGDDMARETLAAADALARRGITIHTLGLGDPDHASFIPVRDNLGRPAQLRYRGELVSTQLQEEVLQAIAERTHGRYFAVGTGYLELDREFGELLAGKESLERQTIHRERHGIHRFQWFVAPAVVLLLLHWLLSDARRADRAAAEKPNYFSWVRRRAEKRINHREHREHREKTKKRNGRLAPSMAKGLFLCVFLCALCDSVVSSWLPAASAGPTQPGDPWTAFRRGNELLRQAQQAGAKADPALLLQAQREYQKCLTRRNATSGAGTLFEDARYNLELTKLLLMQVSRSGTNAGRPDPASPAQEGEAAPPPNDDEKAKEQQRPANTKTKKDRDAGSKDSSGDNSVDKEPSDQQNKADKSEGEKESSEAEKKKSDEEKDKSDTEKNKSDTSKGQANAGENKAKEQSSQQTKQKQQKQQRSQGQSGNGPAGRTDQKRESKPRRSTEGGQGSQSGEGESKQKKQTDQPKDDHESKRDKKQKKDKEETEPQAEDSSSKNKADSDGSSKSSSGQSAGKQEAKKPSTNDARRSAGTIPGTMPDPMDAPREDEERGRGRGKEPDAGGLFHPETPLEKQKQSAPGHGSQGDSAGGGPSKEKTPQEMDPVTQAAVMRLQEAIQRIEKRRSRRVSGPAPGAEDPANMKRYRDW